MTTDTILCLFVNIICIYFLINTHLYNFLCSKDFSSLPSCHLLLGEIENALQYFKKCLESRDGICLDRRMIIEAADGLQKAQVRTTFFLFHFRGTGISRYLLVFSLHLVCTKFTSD